METEIFFCAKATNTAKIFKKRVEKRFKLQEHQQKKEVNYSCQIKTF